MTIISCRNIKKSFGDTVVLKDVTFDINDTDRIGLVGNNGTGKTTLANILFGQLQPDGGNILQHKKPLQIGYLLQSTSYTLNTFNRMFEKENDTEAMKAFLDVTGQLGLEKVQHWDLERFSGLSGGEKTKLALSHIWAKGPDLLILDEPTNHMDSQGIEWLIQELRRFKGAVLLISHDRYFLDQCVTQIIELEDGTVSCYHGNYSYYRAEKRKRHEQQLHLYEIQQKQKQKIQMEIQRLKAWSEKAHREAGKKGKMSEVRMGTKEFYRVKAKKMDKQVKSRIKRLERMETEGVSRPKEEQKILFDIEGAEKRGRRVIEVRDIAKRYGDRVLFENGNFYIQRGDRVGIIGPNGCGKTTLLKILLGEENADKGEVWVSPSVKMAYVSQDVADMDENKNALEILDSRYGSKRTRAVTLLANMGIVGDMLERPVKNLSLGQRTRLKIAKLVLSEHDLLVLDEPTNHLDLHSREQLEDTLDDYDGTILLVSHDRYMLERICNRILSIEKNTFTMIEGGYERFKSGDKEEVKTQPRDKAEIQKEQMIVENRISLVLGELSQCPPGTPEYIALDSEFKELIKKRKELMDS